MPRPAFAFFLLFSLPNYELVDRPEALIPSCAVLLPPLHVSTKSFKAMALKNKIPSPTFQYM